MRLLKQKPIYATAVQYNPGDGTAVLCEFLGSKEIRETATSVTISTPFAQYTLSHGDWLVRESGGGILILSHQDVSNLYELAEFGA